MIPPTSKRTFSLIDPAELATLRAIVAEVAASEPRRWGYRGGECVFCLKEDHEPDCIVSRARVAMKK